MVTYNYWRTFIEAIRIDSVEKAGRLQWIIDTTVSRVGKPEGPISEARLSGLYQFDEATQRVIAKPASFPGYSNDPVP